MVEPLPSKQKTRSSILPSRSILDKPPTITIVQTVTALDTKGGMYLNRRGRAMYGNVLDFMPKQINVRGNLLIVPASGEPTIREVTEMDGLTKTLQDIVGGFIETVPHFNKVVWDGEVLRCVAFCNDEGKLMGLPVNSLATLMWHKQLKKKSVDDVLCGDVVVVWGNDKFMTEL